jgi:hypothetical protein
MATTETDGCFKSAKPGEELFTLLARDKVAPCVVWFWVLLRWVTRKNRWNDPKMKDARQVAAKMRTWRNNNPTV